MQYGSPDSVDLSTNIFIFPSIKFVLLARPRSTFLCCFICPHIPVAPHLCCVAQVLEHSRSAHVRQHGAHARRSGCSLTGWEANKSDGSVTECESCTNQEINYPRIGHNPLCSTPCCDNQCHNTPLPRKVQNNSAKYFGRHRCMAQYACAWAQHSPPRWP